METTINVIYMLMAFGAGMVTTFSIGLLALYYIGRKKIYKDVT